MKCQMCGAEVERKGRNQKYCPTCAAISAKAKVQAWKEKNSTEKAPRLCPLCAAVIEPHRHFCDDCIAERRRTYQREYKRRIRAKK